MNATDAITLCRYVKAACPQQAMDEYTPQAWVDAFADTNAADAQQAARDLIRRQPFVAPSEIIAEVRKIRAARIKAHGDPIPPADLDPAEELTWRQDAWRRIGDGEKIPGRGAHHEVDYDQREAIEAARLQVSR